MPLSGDRHVVALWMDEPPILAAVQPAGHRPPKSDALPRQIRHCGPSAPQATRSRRMQAGPNGRLAPVEARTVDQGQPLRQRPAAATVTGGYTGPALNSGSETLCLALSHVWSLPMLFTSMDNTKVTIYHLISQAGWK